MFGSIDLLLVKRELRVSNVFGFKDKRRKTSVDLQEHGLFSSQPRCEERKRIRENTTHQYTKYIFTLTNKY